jgi:ubiquinone/menaquinone biosynthesis C-methylase UbiE
VQQRPLQRVTRSKLEARSAYNGLSRWYDLVEGRWERPMLRHGLTLLDAQPGEHMLEIGPGTGWALVRIAGDVQPAGIITGLDLSPGMLERARRRVERARLSQQVKLCLGDATDLPFGDETFVGAFLGFVLELFDTPEIPVALSEIRRTLKPGGRLVVVSLSNKRATLVRKLYEWGHEHFPKLLDCRPIDVDGSISAAGFEIETTLLGSIEGLPVEIVRARRPASDRPRPIAPSLP